MFEAPLTFALIALAAAAFVLSPAVRVRGRAIALIVASGIALLVVLELPPTLVALLLGAIAWIAVGLRLTRRVAERAPTLASFLVFAPVLVLWVLGKQSVALGFRPLQILYFVGFSFFLVKAWTLIKDVQDGRLPAPHPVVLGAYFLFFPTYVSGPMHTIDEFQRSLQTPLPLDGATVVDALFRFLLGLLKVKLLSALFQPLSLAALVGVQPIGVKTVILASVAYSIVIWADFSGYSDMAIAASRVIGVMTPENFDRPYLAPNIREFWQRWHISFSRVLTSYVFVPLSRALQRSLGARRDLIMITAYLATFLACGYWHGPTPNFLAWGAYHGLGLIVVDLYQARARKRRPPGRRGAPAGIGPRLRHAAAIGVTFAFVSIGWILFVLPLNQIVRLR